MLYRGNKASLIYAGQGEHVSGKLSPTEISLHIHIAQPDQFKILARTPYTKITEALYIKTTQNKQLLNDRAASYPLLLF